jgi:hypothetical protein
VQAHKTLIHLNMDDPVSDLAAEEEETSIALAAAEAAAAAEEQEQIMARQLHEQQTNHHHTNGSRSVVHHHSSVDFITDEDRRLKCRICGKGMDDDGRVLCHFFPTDVDDHTLDVAPGVVTFGEDIALHVFCGKTASILPNVNQPDLEILSKAGIKNKHGIGPEVNGALARSRSSTVAAEGAKEKTFYIVKEFEAHLAAIRNASLSAAAMNAVAMEHHLGPPTSPFQHHQGSHHLSTTLDVMSGSPGDPSFDPLYQHMSSTSHHNAPKLIPIKASHTYQKRDPWVLSPSDVTITSDGKIRCGCGGTHLPTGTARGDASWRSHVMTKRHQKWMEENGLLGAV